MEEGYITVVDVKHYGYCPRIVFITHCLHLAEKETEAMKLGREEHDERAITPILRLTKASKLLRSVELHSSRLGVSGKVDYVVITRYNEVIPIEVKWAESPSGAIKWDHKLQLATYALLLEDKFGKPVKRCFVYYSRSKKLIELIVGEGLKRLAKKVIEHIHRIAAGEEEPIPRVPLSKCVNCGYLAYCGPGLARVAGAARVGKNARVAPAVPSVERYTKQAREIRRRSE